MDREGWEGGLGKGGKRKECGLPTRSGQVPSRAYTILTTQRNMGSVCNEHGGALVFADGQALAGVVEEEFGGIGCGFVEKEAVGGGGDLGIGG